MAKSVKSGTAVSALQFNLTRRGAAKIRWKLRCPCCQPGCTDRECLCSICDLPVGVPEEDPRWKTHSAYCTECDFCRDQVPLMMFRGAGKLMETATFHLACFEGILAKQPTS